MSKLDQASTQTRVDRMLTNLAEQEEELSKNALTPKYLSINHQGWIVIRDYLASMIPDWYQQMAQEKFEFRGYEVIVNPYQKREFVLLCQPNIELRYGKEVER